MNNFTADSNFGKRWFVFSLLVSFLLGITSCTDSEEPVADHFEMPNIMVTRADEEVVKASNGLCFNFLREMETIEPLFMDSFDKNSFIISPHSLQTCLSMLANAANDSACKEILSLFYEGENLSLKELNAYNKKFTEALAGIKGPKQIGFANLIKVGNKNEQDYFNPFFASLMKESYGAECWENPDKNQILSWIKANAFDSDMRIEEMVDYDDTKFTVINLTSFRGKWETPFKKSATQKKNFTNNDSTTKLVDFIFDTRSADVAALEDCTMLQLPFEGGRFKISFVMPKNTVDIEGLILKLDNRKWEELQSSKTSQYLQVSIPKIKLSSIVGLVPLLYKLGIKEIFEEGGITGVSIYEDSKWCVNHVFQSSMLTLDEEGVETVSLTEADYMNTMSWPDKHFFLDSPFLFFISEEDTGAIIYSGKVGKL